MQKAERVAALALVAAVFAALGGEFR